VTPQIATLVCIAAIAALFRLDRDRSVRTSPALWLPVLWLAIGGTRNVSVWLQLGGPEGDYGSDYLEGSPVDRNTLALLLAMGTVTLCRRGKRLRHVLSHNWPVLAYFAYCALSILWSDYPLVGFKRWFRGIGDVVMVLVVLTDDNWIAAVKRLFTRLAFVLFPLSLLLIRYYPDLGRDYGRDGSVYWTGVASGKNGLGMICLAFGLAMVWRWLVEYHTLPGTARTRRLMALTASIALALWLLRIANSKTSLATLVLVSGLMVLLALSRFGRKLAVLHMLVAVVVGSCASVLFLGIGTSALQTLGRDPTLTGRTDLWNLVLRYADNPLLGAGYESFWLGRHLQDMALINGGNVLNQAHNGYIEVYLNLGWIGLALLGNIIGMGYKNIIAGFRSDTHSSILRIGYFVVALIYNFTEGSFKMMQPVWICFLLATMIVPAMSVTETHIWESSTVEHSGSALPTIPSSTLA
jgi:exopolysaccharide production protein ExoQ